MAQTGGPRKPQNARERREYGSGSYRHRNEERTRWEVRVAAGRDPVTDKWRTVSKTIHGDERAARTALRELRRQVEAERARAQATASSGKLGDLLDRYVRHLEHRGRSPETLRTYRQYIDNRIKPKLGKVPLRRLGVKHLDDFYNELDGALQPASIRQIHAIIRGALHQAMRWDEVTRNVATQATPPSVKRSTAKAPTDEDVRRLLDEAEATDPPLAVFLFAAASTGARRGELCQLRRSHLHLDGPAPSALIYGSKTDRWRPVALDPLVAEAFRRHLHDQAFLAEQEHVTLDPDPFVFARVTDGSKPPDPMWATHGFTKLRKELGLDGVRLHSLRHFAATTLIGAGVDPRTVAGRLGHADPSMTLRVYSHMLVDRDRAASDIMAGALAPAKPKG